MKEIFKKLLKNRNYFFFFTITIFVILNCHTKSANDYKIDYVNQKQYLNILKDSTSFKQEISSKKIFETKQGISIQTKMKDIFFKTRFLLMKIMMDMKNMNINIILKIRINI